MGDAHALVLPDAFGLDVGGPACVPGPGLPVRVQGEGPAGGGDGQCRLGLLGQNGRGLFCQFFVLTVGLVGLEGVDLSLPVYRQQ